MTSAASSSTSTARSCAASPTACTRCPGPSRCSRRSARRAARSRSSPTAATCRPRSSPRDLRADGLPVSDEEMVTPVRSALSYLRRRHAGAPVLLFAQPSVADLLAREGVDVIVPGDGDGAAAAGRGPRRSTSTRRRSPTSSRPRAPSRGGARLLTANYLPAYAGANGPIFSRGAMVTAAIAKAADVRPTVVGKPSRAAVQEVSARLGVPSADLLVIGDDVAHGRRPRPARRLAHRARADGHHGEHGPLAAARAPAAARGDRLGGGTARMAVTLGDVLWTPPADVRDDDAGRTLHGLARAERGVALDDYDALLALVGRRTSRASGRRSGTSSASARTRRTSAC